jgi:GMP synthase-like glutamine amidotransferase
VDIAEGIDAILQGHGFPYALVFAHAIAAAKPVMSIRKPPMRVLVVQNFDDTGLGQVATALAERGIDVDTRRPYCGEPLPVGIREHAALVVLGGEQDALDDVKCPYYPELLELIRACSAADRPVLGICLGAQLMARAFGGENLLGAAPEFGWCEVELTEEGRIDPVMQALPARFPIFEWHDDTFTLPPGAARLATNGTAANQAFRVGRAAYGIQFHFEADRQLVAEWNGIFADYLARRQPGWPQRHPADAALHGPDADAAGLALARAWVGTIGGWVGSRPSD